MESILVMQCNFGESIARVSDRSDKGNFEDAHILTERMASIGRDLQQILAGLASKPRLSLIDFAPVNQAAMNLMQALKAAARSKPTLPAQRRRQARGRASRMGFWNERRRLLRGRDESCRSRVAFDCHTEAL